MMMSLRELKEKILNKPPFLEMASYRFEKVPLDDPEPQAPIEQATSVCWPIRKSLRTLQVAITYIASFCLFVGVSYVCLNHWFSMKPKQHFVSKVPEFSTIPASFEINDDFFAPSEDHINAAWESIMPEGRGFVALPSSTSEDGKDVYCLSVFHQLHCLNLLRTTIRDLKHPQSERSPGHSDHGGHVNHCIEYLRQGIMCAGDTTLEPRDALHHGVQGWGVTHQCRNYGELVGWTESQRSNDHRGVA